jgi:ATP-dependent phosphoenolpyruvate carboxykinase
MTPEQFDAICGRLPGPYGGKDVFVQELFGGADRDHRLPVTRGHRIRLALAVHPPPAAIPEAGDTG